MALPLLAIGAAAAPILGGVIGNIASAGDREKAQALQQQALQSILGVSTPDIEQMKLALEKYQSAGELTPEMLETINAQDSLMGNIQTDPRLRNAQLQALEKLQSIGASGLRPEDEAALARIQSGVAQDARAREEAILQNMQERGVGGSGAELASRLISSQGSANRQSQQGLEVGALASQRALEAIMQSGALGGQIRNQEFGEESEKASAQDVINRYNAMNRQQVSGTNVNSRNTAQAQNLSEKQRIADSNTGVSNQQQIYNKQLAQQNFENQMRKSTAAANAQSNQANNYNQQAGQTQQMISGIGQGVGQAAAAGAGYMQNQDALAAAAAERTKDRNLTKKLYGIT